MSLAAAAAAAAAPSPLLLLLLLLLVHLLLHLFLISVVTAADELILNVFPFFLLFFCASDLVWLNQNQCGRRGAICTADPFALLILFYPATRSLPHFGHSFPAFNHHFFFIFHKHFLWIVSIPCTRSIIAKRQRLIEKQLKRNFIFH